MLHKVVNGNSSFSMDRLNCGCEQLCMYVCILKLMTKFLYVILWDIFGESDVGMKV